MNKKISTNSGPVVPQSFIAKGKQRLKQHDDTVYLNNGDEFQIELYNPTQNKVLAKIELNGSSIGSGIILRPGERVFLERYLDVAKKFKFETYLVDGDDNEVENAIKNNGDVIVRFYNEMFFFTTSNTISYVNYPATYTTLGTNSPSYVGQTFTTNCVTYDALCSTTKSFETGRVEKGSNSNQSFVHDSTNFNSYASESNYWKLKPQSTKPVVSEDLIVYCTECGTKRKKDSFRYCPHCGNRF
jgi:ribosomal protein L44E